MQSKAGLADNKPVCTMATARPLEVDWTQDRNGLARALADLASKAGKAVMDIYADGFKVEDKADGSPLTEADLAADAIIAQGLADIAPSIPLLSEETAHGTSPDSLGDLFFVVDPLDGTREFVDKTKDFSINIALVQGGRPIVGIIYAPARRKLWIAGEDAFTTKLEPGASLDPKSLIAIATKSPETKRLKAVASRSHRDGKTDEFLHALPGCETLAVGSALKFCLVAEGEADVYPRYGPTMVWDTAAGVAIVEAAGGEVLGEDGKPMKVHFGPDGWRNSAFTAWGCAKARDHATARVKQSKS
ncbi:MAG: 3'(2'),5'-bisphosphate nucleotidase CysQ [Cohaesibacteraceae bacterium]